LVETLKPVMDGLEGMLFERIGESSKELRFMFDFSDDESSIQRTGFPVPFDRLSDGQRCLAALYTSVLLAENEECSFLWDEPDNYVSLREIQPWLAAIRDLVEERGRQYVVISHHPELINALAAEHGALIYRDSSGPARVKPFEQQADGVSPAEIVARGWED
jgi:ATPase subunit of ABC transporter with duplicated ATPase domains